MQVRLATCRLRFYEGGLARYAFHSLEGVPTRYLIGAGAPLDLDLGFLLDRRPLNYLVLIGSTQNLLLWRRLHAADPIHSGRFGPVTLLSREARPLALVAHQGASGGVYHLLVLESGQRKVDDLELLEILQVLLQGGD